MQTCWTNSLTQSAYPETLDDSNRHLENLKFPVTSEVFRQQISSTSSMQKQRQKPQGLESNMTTAAILKTGNRLLLLYLTYLYEILLSDV
jgi:hypothetical protein